MNKNLLENLMIAQYAAETDMHYPRYMLALAKDTKRLAKFLDDFLYEEDDNEKPKTVLTPLDQAAFGRLFFVSSLVKTKLPSSNALLDRTLSLPCHPQARLIIPRVMIVVLVASSLVTTECHTVTIQKHNNTNPES
jgi:dTDP-4-amino-4,6-dideoxygalactose transaminase